MVLIRPLEPHDIQQVALWHCQEWNHKHPVSRHKHSQDCIDKLEQQLALNSKQTQQQSSKQTLNQVLAPFTLVAENSEGNLCGCVSLSLSTVQANHCDSLWLHNLFVTIDNRSQGIAKALIQATVDRAHNQKYNTLRLFTDSLGQYYKNLGWQEQAHARVAGSEGTIMSLPLKNIP